LHKKLGAEASRVVDKARRLILATPGEFQKIRVSCLICCYRSSETVL